MGIKDIVQLNAEQREEILKSCPPPDRYILLSSSNTMTEEQLDQFYSDTRAKADAAQKIVDNKSIDFNSPEFVEFAQRYVQDTINMLMNDPSIGKDGQMAFVLGSPGAGKSSAIKTEKEKLGAWHADADKIKEKLSTDLGIDVNHPEMHKASGFIMKNYVIPALLQNKINFIQEKIGDEVGKMVTYSEDYVQQGYEVSLTLVHCDYNVCRQRNCKRCLSSIAKGEVPRLVEDEAIVGYANSPMETYMYLMENVGHLFAHGTAYCSDGPSPDVPPQVLEALTYEKGKRVNSPEVQAYMAQGQELKQKAIILSSKAIMAQLTARGLEDVAQSIHDEIVEYLETDNFTATNPETQELLGVINNKANQLLITVLNPSKNVRGIGEPFNISNLEQLMLNEAGRVLNPQELNQALDAMLVNVYETN